MMAALIALTGSGARLDLQAGSDVALTSPAAGPYANIQFLQRDEASTSGLTSTLQGTARLSYDGLMLIPSQKLEITGNAKLTAKSPNYAIIADTLLVHGNGSLAITTENARNLAVGPSTFTGGGAVLIR